MGSAAGDRASIILSGIATVLPVSGTKFFCSHFDFDRLRPEEERVGLPRPVERDPTVCLPRHRHALKEVAPKGIGTALDALPPAGRAQQMGPPRAVVTLVQHILKVEDLTDPSVDCDDGGLSP